MQTWIPKTETNTPIIDLTNELLWANSIANWPQSMSGIFINEETKNKLILTCTDYGAWSMQLNPGIELKPSDDIEVLVPIIRFTANATIDVTVPNYTYEWIARPVIQKIRVGAAGIIYIDYNLQYRIRNLSGSLRRGVGQTAYYTAPLLTSVFWSIIGRQYYQCKLSPPGQVFTIDSTDEATHVATSFTTKTTPLVKKIFNKLLRKKGN